MWQLWLCLSISLVFPLLFPAMMASKDICYNFLVCVTLKYDTNRIALQIQLQRISSTRFPVVFSFHSEHVTLKLTKTIY